tara:strand:- start:744 stop:1100 length:357 start_codon:yes stop_codon:yes gene_type:complete
MTNSCCNNVPPVYEYLNKNNILKIIESPQSFSDFAFDFCENDSTGLWNNVEFMSKLVQKDGMYLEGGSNSIKKNIDVCLKAINQNLKAKKFIDVSIRKIVVDKFISETKESISKIKKN